jgi:predicted Zn-dependent protease
MGFPARFSVGIGMIASTCFGFNMWSGMEWAHFMTYLSFSRRDEREADHIGIFLMAKAGYNPREATTFFENMLKKRGSKSLLEKLTSTHPLDEERIANLNNLLPEANAIYQERVRHKQSSSRYDKQ